MRTRSVSGRLTLSIVLLLYGDQLATENAEGVCKTKQSHDVYVPSNNLSCERDVSDNKSFVIERYRPMKKCTSDFDITDVLVFTVASNETDGFRRYLRSAEIHGFHDKLNVLGLGEPWKGGNVVRYAGGGYKINLLKKALEDYQNDEKKIILFTDSYDVIFLGDLSTIVERFLDTDARVLFSAEAYCWPDKSLATQYPPVSRGKRYLNSGGFIGYASDVYKILETAIIKDEDDDQLFYTTVYLQDELRLRYKIKLDHKSEIFQNLYGAVADVELRFKGEEAYLQNIVYNTVPLVLHGNGPSKLVLNSLGNYLARAWTPDEGCLACWDQTIELDKMKPKTYPVILIAIFIERPTPFLEEFFRAIYRQYYPKSKLHLFVHNNVPYHEDVVDDFFEKIGQEYLSAKRILPSDDVSEVDARKLAMEHCLLKECSGYLSIDAVAHLDNEHALKLLVEQQRGIVAPLLIRPFKAWSNFWGAITDDGFYARSFDYMEIIKNERRGLWNVPFVSNCYLINATIIANKATRPTYEAGDLDTEMAFAHGNRQRGLFMYVNNRLEFGHLVDPDTYDIRLIYPDMYQIMENKLDWEKRYIHPNYSENFNPDKKPIQPCPDVYWFPIVNLRFTKELVGVVETFGQWSDGTNHDPRLSGGYENVPTRDIHMNQVQYDQQWLYFLKEYVRPLQELVFTGYFHDPPRSLMNFIVRYRPDEQPLLRPHHDSSTYTINIALNQAGVDYEGGGCRFIRYNCSVTDTKPGWMLMHPGRLTHYHEGLRVTAGTRYIMISFVDP
ncbi:PREDICTED: procollagen-lysine,2-oxoglutarate 5-dioxygenase 1 isoform X1 [Trachymyrmex cornetzi]|uniref:procollagen-lysine,2-oxoglutarate 5-dioxygenase 1 isoform X1 n=1 Tax=Trachymyrmex cornetzi TaxID=471704 RepID=UPI00084ED685|nr:PREDICTED: procollagen-lysine,2-oxoglutarate 5-dioxygenase 1 isoform X1 [Trachymyrmex cornetzi]XP_018363865.1 PREDICTED: procollagen-lysine,2-oxoglutarate 5-dioxygenase 1 isoform X1 [Trachymyrmex cornetzi]XP_018363866.1 PREDICTED: procollagen-lysine,2-oxoglutarate 5-dioxygenase 1 isoform X1 [Trachymyrmex cornetzi]